MKRTQLFVKTLKDAPSDEVAKNAQLLIRAGFVHKVMAGVYVYTPLGIRVVEKIKQIVREEMDAIGGAELIMSALQRPDTWETTGRCWVLKPHARSINVRSVNSGRFSDIVEYRRSVCFIKHLDI